MRNHDCVEMLHVHILRGGTLQLIFVSELLHHRASINNTTESSEMWRFKEDTVGVPGETGLLFALKLLKRVGVDGSHEHAT